jgi:hypothetical protein
MDERIKVLMETIERQQNEIAAWEAENSLMAEKHAEKDMAIAEFMRIIEQQEQKSRDYRRRIFELKRMTGDQVYEENLRLLAEIEKLKSGVLV